jgi:ABC-2 type transport system ATP-binding protein
MTSALSITDLRKTYTDKKGGAKEALKGITLDVPEGSFFGLLGPNGAGKSTLINIMAGLVIKTSGSVAICGHDIVADMRQARRALGVVPQELILDTFFTVREALDNQAGYYGVPKAQRRTQEIIDAMGLSDKADIHSRRLSGGMRRRLLVAKALVHSPRVLVLDEPTAGVDVELRTQLWNYVRELNKQGTTVLLTTHYLEEAEELCDRIAIINHGQVIANESKRELMKSVDRKQLMVTPKTALTTVPPSLAGLEASLTAEGQLTISYRPSSDHLQDILARIQQAGVDIRDVTTHQADLEDVFRQLISSGVAKAA